jgi:hypothetical protein
MAQSHVPQTKNTLKVINILRKYTNKKIITKDIKELESDHGIVPSYLGAAYESIDSITIYLNLSYESNTREATFVHELLHRILKYEGFPEVVINQDVARNLPTEWNNALYALQSQFSSSIEHPEIFRRMESEFELSIYPYYEVQYKRKLELFNKSLKYKYEYTELFTETQEYYFHRQQDILIGVEYFFYPENLKVMIFEVFKKLHPDAYESCLSMYEKVRKIGFNTPRSVIKSGNIILSHIIKYGNRKGVGLFNTMWKALELTEP